MFFLLSSLVSYSQDTWQVIIENDTLTEVGREVLQIETDLYVANRTRCQPDAQSCVKLLKYDRYGKLIWEAEMPSIKMGNDNVMHLHNSSIIITGRSNDGAIPLKYGFYEIDTSGTILDFTEIILPYESNFNYGSLIKGDTLYMYGTAREDLSEEGINVDALIVTYDLVKDTFSYEYFDYGHDFIDIWDMRMVEDGSILFYSAHRRQEYVGDSLDYVVERIWPNGHRIEIYNVTSNSDGGVSIPQMEYLGDDLLVIHFPNEEWHEKKYPNFRIINLKGDLLYEKRYEFLKQNSVSYVGDIRKTNDGDILICGRYFDKMVSDDDLPLNANAFVSKMSREGEIEWFRHFRQEETDGEPVWSGFSSLLTLSDNGIVAVGNIERSPSDLLIMKLDEDGCFSPDDCGGGVITDVEEVEVEDDSHQIMLFPNPVQRNQPLRIEINKSIKANKVLDLKIMDRNGRNIINQEIYSIDMNVDISMLNNGVYIVVMTDQYGNQLIVEKLIVI
jgi:hypothetical protein